ncbi:DUF1028 domain-containing protein [Amycolatopsis jejuensis]|uniref:DUF1028 domain-containing protein n=1 Tax=Amycolatopsis jejuensis TaxID=330084 RepID=UPI000689B107|nr:DUF1028 domain-containing protein [Amycolatopsis jejuensis]
MTFSAILRDPATGALGALIASARPAVGARTVLGAPDLLVVTQAKASTSLADDVQRRRRSGSSLEDAVTGAFAADREPHLRQLLAIALDGPPFATTGDRVPSAAATATGTDHACAGNLLSSGDVVGAMDEICRSGGEVVETLLAAGHAAESAGGDARGRQSAALVVWQQDSWPVVDLRVDDHPEPLTELTRLWDLWRGTWGVFAETGEFPPARPAWVRPGR